MVPAGCSRYARRHQLKVRPLGRSSHRNAARHIPAAAAAPPVAPSAGRSLPASSGSPRVLRRAALPAATMMLALQIRLCTAFASTAALSTTTTATATAVRFHRSRGAVAAIGHRRGGVPDGRRGAGTVALVAAGRTPTPTAAALRAAMPRGAATDATAPPPSAEGEVEFERDGETGSRSGVEPMDDERYLMRAERKRRRKLARQARLHNLGRAKSVRRAGSSSEMVGLEALHPPRGLPGSGAPALSGLPDMSKPFTVLGIETSCDDTAAAVVRSDGEVLGEAIAGQAEVHEEWGGVVPGLARDSHALKMDGVVEKALEKAGLDSVNEVDAVAVTVGPGLEICLRVGAEKAKALATQYGKPFVAVHHLEAHALLARKAFPPTQASSANAASATTGSTSLSAPAEVSAAAAAASAAPSAGAFAAAFTAAVSDVSIAKSRSTPSSSAATAAATAAADDVPAARGAPADAGSSAAAGGSVSAAAAAASAAPSATAFAAAFTAAVSDVSRSAANESPSARTSPPPRSPVAAGGVSAVPPSDTDGSVESDSEKAEDGEDTPALEFPFLGLLVSGGHCQLLLCKGVGQYTILGGTVDDALGEAYDKAARLLGLRVGGGGGPAVEALALRGDPTAVPLTVPMQSRKDLDFSFAGLKNSFRMAVTRAVEEREEHDGQRRQEEKGEELEEGGAGINGEGTRHDAEGKGDDETEASDGLEGGEENLSPTASMERRGAALPESMRADLAASFQHTAIKHLEERVRRAMGTCDAMLTTSAGSADDARSTGEPSDGVELQSPRGGSEETSGRDRATEGGEERKGVRALAVVGGVAANQELRRRLQALCDDRQPAPWKMVVPPARLCTDNGVMVAWAAIERLREGMSNDAESQEVYARLPLGRSAGQEDVGVGSL